MKTFSDSDFSKRKKKAEQRKLAPVTSTSLPKKQTKHL
jgi:hypothetical protein